MYGDGDGGGDGDGNISETDTDQGDDIALGMIESWKKSDSAKQCTAVQGSARQYKAIQGSTRNAGHHRTGQSTTV